MRTTQKLFDIEDVTILLQYLYINEDNFVEYETEPFNFMYKLYMNKDMELYVINEDFPDIKTPCYYQVNNLIDIIYQLKDQKIHEFGREMTKWEYIKLITNSTRGLNFFKK